MEGATGNCKKESGEIDKLSEQAHLTAVAPVLLSSYIGLYRYELFFFFILFVFQCYFFNDISHL